MFPQEGQQYMLIPIYSMPTVKNASVTEEFMLFIYSEILIKFKRSILI